MEMQHPGITIQRTSFARILDVAALAFVVGGFLAGSNQFKRLPPVLPRHFDGSGKADAFGSKNILWLLPTANAVVCYLLSVATRFPHRFNFPYAITTENAVSQ